MTSEQLRQNPKSCLEITDDTEAELFLSELGLLDRFVGNRTAEATIQSVVSSGHPTHHILALLYLGRSKASDDGFLVLCLPKAHYSDSAFLQFAQQILKTTPENLDPAKPPADTSTSAITPRLPQRKSAATRFL
jgi:hypothetical protein